LNIFVQIFQKQNLIMRKTIFKGLRLLIVGLVLIFAFSSCITAKKTNYLQKPSLHIPSYDVSVGYEEYVLVPYDRVYVRVYSLDKNINTLINGITSSSMASMSSSDYSELYTYTIAQDGTINIPMVGDVKIGGQYVREAKNTLKNAIQKVMFDECAVDLRIMGRYFSVIGRNMNGKYPIFREKMNIFQALAMAGDMSMIGDRSKIKILRETPGGETSVKTFDIRSKDIINSEFYYIQPNDVIYIQEMKSQFFSVTSVGNVFSTFFSTVSFGMLIYNMTKPKPETPSDGTN